MTSVPRNAAPFSCIKATDKTLVFGGSYRANILKFAPYDSIIRLVLQYWVTWTVFVYINQAVSKQGLTKSTTFKQQTMTKISNGHCTWEFNVCAINLFVKPIIQIYRNSEIEYLNTEYHFSVRMYLYYHELIAYLFCLRIWIWMMKLNELALIDQIFLFVVKTSTLLMVVHFVHKLSLFFWNR